MKGASAGMPIRDFDEPSDKVKNGDKVAVPFVGGLTVEEATARLKDAGFKAQVAGSANSGYSRGRVVYTSPNGTALRGDTIGLYTSTGYIPQAPAPRASSTPKPKATPSSTPTPKKKTKPTPPPKKTKN